MRGLTPEQQQAVTHGSGSLLLLAGPGAGKTRTLTHRAAYLLATGRARPWEILAVTFSVRAAGELRLRLAELLGETVARAVTAATFHSVCARLLREHASVFGRTERYTIYDQGDMRRVVDWLLSDAERGQIQQALQDCGQPASVEVLSEISRAKNLLLTPESYERSATAHPAAPLIAAVWRESEAELRRSNAFDFDDLLAFAVRLVSEHRRRLQWLRQRYRWILVDEFQDTSHAQAMLVDLLSGPAGNLCVVGDDDQCLEAGTLVTMADGTRKPIEFIRPGEQVLSAHGGGVFGSSRVLCVTNSRRQHAVEITTVAGRRLVSTPEHIHFAGYRYGTTPQLYLTYLMRRGDRFRLGTTSVYTGATVKPVLGLHNRCVQEHADAVWVVSTHTGEQEARLEELRLSLRYGIPQLPFVASRESIGRAVAWSRIRH